MGEEFVPDMAPVKRARASDLNKPMDYRLAFTRNGAGRPVLDRRYNTAALLAAYYGDLDAMLKTVAWDIGDPNDLAVALPSGGNVATRVTRRLQEAPGPQRLDTSEYLRQTFASPDSQGSRVKASQCYTKYKWRSAEDAAASGGVQIVATQVRPRPPAALRRAAVALTERRRSGCMSVAGTAWHCACIAGRNNRTTAVLRAQVVSEYLTTFDGDALFVRSMGKPVVIYTYRMAFMRDPGQAAVA